MLVDLIRAIWPVGVGIIGFLGWLIRLEARSIENSKDIKRLWNQRSEDLEAAKQSRQETSAMLSEIRDDIKALIAKVGS